MPNPIGNRPKDFSGFLLTATAKNAKNFQAIKTAF